MSAIPQRRITQWASVERGYEDTILWWSTDRAYAEAELRQECAAGLDSHLVTREVLEMPWREADA